MLVLVALAVSEVKGTVDSCPRLRRPSFFRLIALKDSGEEGEAEAGEKPFIGGHRGKQLHHVLHAELRGGGEEDSKIGEAPVGLVEAVLQDS